MADGARRGPCETANDDSPQVDFAVAFGSLVLLFAGLVGLATSTPMLSGSAILLYALIGLGSATLSFLGSRGWKLVTLSPPLGLAISLVLGTALATLHLWAIGEVLFWTLAALGSLQHLRVVARTFPYLGRVPSTRDRPHAMGSWKGRVARVTSSQGSGPRGLEVAVGIATALGFALALVSALSIRHLNPGWGGLLVAISPAWYVGLGLLAVAVLIGQRLRSFFAAAPVIVLQLVLIGTSAVVFDEPRYSWTLQKVGETAYIMLHGSANANIDIYQAWPGLFAGVAWLCHVSNVATPLMVARWWPSVIDLATALVFYQLASRVLRVPQRAWLATMLFVFGYTINDSDYFSPQSAGYFMAILIFAVVFKDQDGRQSMSKADWVILWFASLAIAMTHQLTPYMVTGALVILVLFRRARSEWAPVVVFAPAVAWALAHFNYVANNFSISGLANILSNLLTPGVSGGGPSPSQLANVTRYFQGGTPLLLGLIAVASIVRGRTKLHFTLAVCAASGGALIVANSYGNEASFRVVLFALPWLAILASDFQLRSRIVSTVFWSTAVFVLLGGYLMADHALDFVYVVRPGDVQAMSTFESTAPVGSTLILIGNPGNEPNGLTGRFNVVHEDAYFQVPTVNSQSLFSFSSFMSHLLTTRDFFPPQSPYFSLNFYVMTSTQSAAGMAAYNLATLKEYQGLTKQFETSKLWQTVVNTPTAQLFRLRVRPSPRN